MSINLRVLCFHILAQFEHVVALHASQTASVGIRQAVIEIPFINTNGDGANFELSPVPISLELAYTRAQSVPDILVDIHLSALRHAHRSSIGRLSIQLNLAEKRTNSLAQATLQPQE